MSSTGGGNPLGNIDNFRCRGILAALLVMLARLPRSIFEYLYVLWMPGMVLSVDYRTAGYASPLVPVSLYSRASRIVFTMMTNREV